MVPVARGEDVTEHNDTHIFCCQGAYFWYQYEIFLAVVSRLQLKDPTELFGHYL